MNVDLHTHTYPASDCSAISYRDYIAGCVEHDIQAVALTNHGDVDDNRKLAAPLEAEGVLLLHGVEISTLFGDFVVFSPDLDFLAGFRDVQEAPRAGDLPEEAAVVWVHPGAGGGRSGSSYYPGLERLVAEVVDAVEVYNSSWLGDRYVTIAEEIALQLGAARTGGSDAHEPGQLMACYTELPDPVRSTADLVTALKGRLTVPHIGRGAARPRRRRFGLF
jgi:predicted metal-dependent phosphoesterase TrpH